MSKIKPGGWFAMRKYGDGIFKLPADPRTINRIYLAAMRYIASEKYGGPEYNELVKACDKAKKAKLVK